MSISLLSIIVGFCCFYPCAVSGVQIPWGDINIVAVTDVHSWVAGHGRHPDWSSAANAPSDADYGDVLSFYRELQAQALDEKRDLFFVMNGDFMDGTGLGTVPPEALLSILMRMPWDAVNIGNHELYHNETIEYMMSSGFIENWRGGYLTSNVDLVEPTERPLGDRYTYLYGPNSNTTILTFGFLYNFQGNCAMTRVRTVQQVVREKWFQTVLRKDDFDAVLILAHMDYRDPLVSVLLKAVRDIVGEHMPVQFINGHSHVRGFEALDEAAVSFEPGHFLDTVGFASFPVKATVKRATNRTGLFQHVFLDANKEELSQTTIGVDALSTPEGESLSLSINLTRSSLGLSTVIGCVPSTYRLQESLTEPTSLWKLFMEQVIPSQLFGYNESQVYIENTGAFRFDLYAGEAVLDDVVAVAPFNDPVFKVAENVHGGDLLNALAALNAVGPAPGSVLPRMISSADGKIKPEESYDIFTADFDSQRVSEALLNVTKPILIPVLDDHNQFMTTTALWRDFVRTECWCRPVDPESTHWIIASLVISTIVLCSFWFLQRSIDRQAALERDEARNPLVNGYPAAVPATYGAV